MSAEYVVTKTEPNIYIDRNNQPVKGYRITVALTKFPDEIHYLYVPRLDDVLVKAEADKLVANRLKISQI